MPWVGAYLFWYLFCKKVRNRLKYLIYMIVKCLQHIQVEKSFCSSVSLFFPWYLCFSFPLMIFNTHIIKKKKKKKKLRTNLVAKILN